MAIMKYLETLEIINLSQTEKILKKGQTLFAFKTIGLFNIPVFLVRETKENMQHSWSNGNTRNRIMASKQKVERLAASILPVLQRHQPLQLDLRKKNAISNVNIDTSD